ncbi:MAG TPA: hypothetical protein VI259_19405 [Gemmatimonadaceae bacterium]
MTRMSKAYPASLLPAALLAVVISACASEKPVAPADVAPLLAAVVHTVDSVVGPRDTLAIDPRILLRPRMWRRGVVITDWPEANLAAAINPSHPRLDLGMLAFVCPVRTPGCSATRQRAVLALGEPVLHRDTAVVEALYASRGSDDRVTQLHWLWFALRQSNSWRIVNHSRLD